jgi:hypothetical protein
MKALMKEIALILVVLALAFGIVCFEAWIGMLLFNWVAGLFGCAFALTFWQAFGICVLLDFVGSFFRTNSKKN